MLGTKFSRRMMESGMTKPSDDGLYELDCDPELFDCVETFLIDGMQRVNHVQFAHAVRVDTFCAVHAASPHCRREHE
jgi:hypothetical protein